MQVGKGDIRAQRQRRRDRYRGCRVCGMRGAQCTECGHASRIVAVHGYASLLLVVDGSFVESASGGPGHGGAGLVLVRATGSRGFDTDTNTEILASRACGFRASSSSDAEFHAVIRGARWAPGVAIYTDARDLPVKMFGVNARLTVHYLEPTARRDAYALAHRLSVEGRCREAPETTPAFGVEFAAGRPQRSKAERRRMGAELLLEQARLDPSFDGDFTAIAERLGWNSGTRWRDNPAIRIAVARWQDAMTKEKATR